MREILDKVWNRFGWKPAKELVPAIEKNEQKVKKVISELLKEKRRFLIIIITEREILDELEELDTSVLPKVTEKKWREYWVRRLKRTLVSIVLRYIIYSLDPHEWKMYKGLDGTTLICGGAVVMNTLNPKRNPRQIGFLNWQGRLVRV